MFQTTKLKNYLNLFFFPKIKMSHSSAKKNKSRIGILLRTEQSEKKEFVIDKIKYKNQHKSEEKNMKIEEEEVIHELKEDLKKIKHEKANYISYYDEHLKKIEPKKEAIKAEKEISERLKELRDHHSPQNKEDLPKNHSK